MVQNVSTLSGQTNDAEERPWKLNNHELEIQILRHL